MRIRNAKLYKVTLPQKCLKDVLSMNESGNSGDTTNSLHASLKTVSETLDGFRFPSLPICCWFVFWPIKNDWCSLQIYRCCFRFEVPDLDAHEKILWKWWHTHLSRVSLVLVKCSHTRDLGTTNFFTLFAWEDAPDVAFALALVSWYTWSSHCISTSVCWLSKAEDVICKRKKNYY